LYLKTTIVNTDPERAMTQTVMRHEQAADMQILIIGSGFAGICMAIRLKQAGIHSFTILERAPELGGTWRDNTYPGCACDVQSHVYSFSFEPNPTWSRMFAGQPEINAYLKHCANKYGILPHVRCGENVVRAEYDESSCTWTVHTSTGGTYRARVVVSGMGGLSNPAYPQIPGLDRFEGRSFHSAAWDHDFDLRGKRVAVIGTGASAIQFVPQIAPQVEKLFVYQRSAPWIVSKADRRVTRLEQALFRKLPFMQGLMRQALYWKLESRAFAFVVKPELMQQAERMAKNHIEKQVRDPELRRKVTPDYQIGCKRILLSDDYYPALTRPNVDLITTPIREVGAHSVIDQNGNERPVDAIVFGTGFRTQDFIERGAFTGVGGTDIVDAWRGGIEAYKGATVSGFPNLFFICGPNTGLGHNSIIYMIEAACSYILDAIVTMRERGWAAVDVRPEVQAAYNRDLQAKLGTAIWQSGCKSWYLDENGRNTALWPDFTFRFKKLTRSFDAEAYRPVRLGDVVAAGSDSAIHESVAAAAAATA
jgi:cation diffusion facilitator CzcD-associated flavoprotein CzcO